MKPLRLLICTGALLNACSSTWLPLGAREPEWSGLGAVAASPDGKTVVAGGQNRVLYVIDSGTLAVKRRVWLGSRIGFVAYDRHGSRVVVETEEKRLYWFETASWNQTRRVENADRASVSVAADLVAAYGNGWRRRSIHLFSLSGGSGKGSFSLPVRISAHALDAPGRRLFVLSTPSPSKTEKRVPWQARPKGLRGTARIEFEQKHDGYASQMLVFEVPSGKLLRKHDLWYSTRASAIVVVRGDDAYVVNYSNSNARIDGRGNVALFETANSFNYGRGASEDRAAVLTGGLRTGTLTSIPSLERFRFELDRLPGWPEYFAAFAFGPGGIGYGVTSAFRIARISRQGKLLGVAAVY